MIRKALFWLIAALITAAAPLAYPQQLTAQQIIDKHIEAVGGKGALARIKTQIAVGTVSRENEAGAKMAIMSEAPNRVSAWFVFNAYTWQLTYDGKNVIFRPSYGETFGPIETKYREMLISGTMFNDISLYNLLYGADAGDLKLELKGTKKVRGKTAYEIEIKHGKSHPMKIYVDKDDFMWLRTDYGVVDFKSQMRAFSNRPSDHGADEISISFAIDTTDFKVVDGVKLPFRFTMTATAPLLRRSSEGVIEGTVTEYQHNVPIDPKMFE